MILNLQVTDSPWKALLRVFSGKPQPDGNRIPLTRQIEGVTELQRSLLSHAPLNEKIRSITEGVVAHFGADFCRIWLIRQGDRCESGCVHATATEGEHVCRHRDRCLHLIASSGRYSHIDGKGHRRVPFGCYKIGRIASGDNLKFLISDVANDPHVHDRGWARSLGLVSFAGYQLRAPGEPSFGVMALFSKRAILPEEDALLSGLSSAVALAVQRSSTEDSLRNQEEQFRLIAENTSDTITVFDLELSPIYVSPSVEKLRGYTVEEAIHQPLSAILTSASLLETTRAFAGEMAHEIKGTYRASRTVLREVQMIRKDGSTINVELSLSLLRDTSLKATAVVTVAREITGSTLSA
jgi:PAS domain S-box-containing protein